MSEWTCELRKLDKSRLETFEKLKGHHANVQKLVKKQLFLAIEEHWLADLRIVDATPGQEAKFVGLENKIGVAGIENKIVNVEFHRLFKLDKNVLVMGVPGLHQVEMSKSLRKALQKDNLVGHKLRFNIEKGKIEFLGLSG